jgi:hypothetical protein
MSKYCYTFYIKHEQGQTRFTTWGDSYPQALRAMFESCNEGGIYVLDFDHEEEES